jgi:tRNA/tmRNA/rRNA uracil-C5-methylase (TrmA/RlmC/RlmD family)
MVHESLDYICKESKQSPAWHAIVPSPQIYGYRNKLEFSWGNEISARRNIHESFRLGFHIEGDFRTIIDCHFCALGDDVINTALQQVRRWSQASGYPTYDPVQHAGFFRHCVMRRSIKHNTLMLVLSVRPSEIGEEVFLAWKEEVKVWAQELSAGVLPQLVSVYLLHNE